MPRTKARFIVTTLLALVTGTAAASDWQTVYSDDEVSLTMDVASLVRDGPIVRAWLRTVYAKPKDLAGGQKASSTRSRQFFDCKNRRSAIKQITIFADPYGAKVLQASPDIADVLLEWSDDAPDSVGEVQLEFACSHAPQK